MCEYPHPVGSAMYIRDLSLRMLRPHYNRRQRKNKHIRVIEIAESDLSNFTGRVIYHACEQMDGAWVYYNMTLFSRAYIYLRW
jgi:hypothetical protein